MAAATAAVEPATTESTSVKPTHAALAPRGETAGHAAVVVAAKRAGVQAGAVVGSLKAAIIMCVAVIARIAVNAASEIGMTAVICVPIKEVRTACDPRPVVKVNAMVIPVETPRVPAPAEAEER